MSHDFAKIRPEPLLEPRVVQAPPAWSLMLTGMVVGMAFGVFGCVLFYLSGRVPPLDGAQAATVSPAPAVQATQNTAPAPLAEPELSFDFYKALEDYEVTVDSVPVQLTEQQMPDALMGEPFLLQSGAFEQRESAEREMARQQLIGLQVSIKQQELVGRTLFLLQSGPYPTSGLLSEAERLLRQSGIPHIRLKQQ
jgi:cell division protein FtsN